MPKTFSRKQIAFLSVFVAVAIVLGFAAKEIFGNHDLADQIRLAKAEHVPLEPADLQAERVPDSQNAATFILRADALSHSTDLEATKDFSKSFRFSEHRGYTQMRFGDEAVLNRLQPVLDALRSASRMPKLQIKRDWERGPGLLFPEYAVIRTGVKMLVADSAREQRHGRGAAALEDLLAAARISRLIAQDPTIIAALVSVACDVTIESELQAQLGNEKLKPGISRPIRELLDSLGPVPSLRNALGGEIVMERESLKLLRNSNVRELLGTNDVPASLRLGSIQRVRDAFDANLIRYWRKCFQEIPNDEDPIGAATGMHATETWLMSQTGWSFDYVKFTHPVFNGFAMLESDEVARRRALGTLGEILELKAKDPSATIRLKPSKEHTDPYTGQPLKVVPKPGGWIVYSLGRDKVDDGGVRSAGASNDHQPNIGFAYPVLPWAGGRSTNVKTARENQL